MDSARTQAEKTSAPRPAGVTAPGAPAPRWQPGAPLAGELYHLAEAALCGLTLLEFCNALSRVGERYHFGQPATAQPDSAQPDPAQPDPAQPAAAQPDPAAQADFYRSLRLADLALAQGCALGRQPAWERFLALYRGPVLQAAIAIGGSATAGHELADALTADLFGLRERDGERTSPLASYSGRGSLLGWLRTTLAQRHVDRHRRTRRETSLEEVELPAPPAAQTPATEELTQLGAAVVKTLAELPAADRYLLAAYYLDRQTLAVLGRILNVHEATVSRRLKRLAEDVNKQLLRNLQAAGLSRRAAQERLELDPRDLEINFRAALQSAQIAPFPAQGNHA